MEYLVQDRDKRLILNNQITYKYRLFVIKRNIEYNEDSSVKNVIMEVVDCLEGVQSIGEYSVNAESDVRRTTSFVLQLDDYYRGKSIEQKIKFWLGYDFQLQIGVFDYRENDYVWYECGYYTITASNTSYSATSNTLNVTLSDWISRLDGTRNGTFGGAPTVEIPAYEEIKEGDEDYDKDSDEEHQYRYTIIKEAVDTWLKESTDVFNYMVDEIGEYRGFPENNENWETYRVEHPEWNQLPYTLTFSGSDSFYTMLKQIVELYPNYQCFFDIYGNLIINMYPTKENDPIILDNNFLQKVLLADDTENVTYNIEQIKNVTEIWGKSYDPDRFCTIIEGDDYTHVETNTVDGLTMYSLFLKEHLGYSSGEMIAFTASSDNVCPMYLRIIALNTSEETGKEETVIYDPIPILRDGQSEFVGENEMLKDSTYVGKVKKIINDDNTSSYVFYFLGQYQPHAMCVLSDDAEDEKYTIDYFSEKYNCKADNITLRIEPDSPFSVQRIGEVLECNMDGDFENVESDSVAIENSIYYNRKSSSFNETVTIKTKMIPWLDVHQKVSYCKKQEDEEHEYIIKSVTHDLSGMTSTITMYRFYPLYYVDLFKD